MKPEVLNGILTLYGILIVYLLIQSLTSNTKEFAVPGASTTLGLDEQAWSNLHAIIHQLYSGGILTIPGNVHIKGDLLVGTYKDETGVEKGWEDSIEHTCVWDAKKGGAETSAAKWMFESSTQPNRARYAKPSAGGGVFSFRAGHMDLHPIFISRKLARSTTGTSVDANSLIVANYRKWNPPAPEDEDLNSVIHFLPFHTPGHNTNRQKLSNIHEVKTHHLFVDDISKSDYDSSYGWIRFHNDVHIGWSKGLDIESLNVNGNVQIDGGLRVDGITQLEGDVKMWGMVKPGITRKGGMGWLWGNGDSLAINYNNHNGRDNSKTGAW